MFAYRWSQIKTRYRHISEICFIFLIANTYRILKCLKRIIQLLFKPHYMFDHKEIGSKIRNYESLLALFNYC